MPGGVAIMVPAVHPHSVAASDRTANMGQASFAADYYTSCQLQPHRTPGLLSVTQTAFAAKGALYHALHQVHADLRRFSGRGSRSAWDRLFGTKNQLKRSQKVQGTTTPEFLLIGYGDSPRAPIACQGNASPKSILCL
ncbi:hypothetical protein CSUB01_02068 [Colletotrichum sublineola]|uniref:Uncharacterized protein n=1 Tax=Colletotrichum sublineola TaxID=1173701 RepID=A0A066X8L5_COLSU|nr:hypothetical protein CSUB01_02068 [Colletotrichum sublineola]